MSVLFVKKLIIAIFVHLLERFLPSFSRFSGTSNDEMVLLHQEFDLIAQ